MREFLDSVFLSGKIHPALHGPIIWDSGMNIRMKVSMQQFLRFYFLPGDTAWLANSYACNCASAAMVDHTLKLCIKAKPFFLTLLLLGYFTQQAEK